MASFSDNSYEVLLCKSWFKKCGKKIKKFVKKHKKAIIIGTVIVVAVIVGVVVGTKDSNNNKTPPSASTPPTTSVVNEKTIEAAKAPSEDIEITQSQTEEPKIIIPDEFDFNEGSLYNEFSYSSKEIYDEKTSTTSNDYENLYSALNNHGSFENKDCSISEIVENNIYDISYEYNYLLQEIDAYQDTASDSFGDNLKYFGSCLAHDILDDIAEYASIAPKLVEECRDLAQSLNLETIGTPEDQGPVEKFNNFSNACHEIIDQVFATEMAESYTQESKNLLNEIGATPTIGFLPPPTGALGFKSIKNDKGRLLPTQTSNIRGWKLGDPINNRTITGKEPKWRAVKQRRWKNEAYYNSKDYNQKELNRMKKGLAPQGKNKITGQIESKELHHAPPQRDGGMYDIDPVWPDEHAELDPRRHTGR